MTYRHRLASTAPLLALALSVAAPSAHASYTLTFSQSGSDVLAVGAGTIDMDLFTYAGQGAVTGAYVTPDAQPDVAVGPPADDPATYLAVWNAGIGGPSSIGPGGRTYADVSSGDTVGMSGANLYLPQDAGPRTPLSSQSTFLNKTLDGLGLTPGTYTYRLGFNQEFDSFTIVVSRDAGAAVPEPASVALLSIGLLGLVRYRRKAT